ncbi:MAG: large transcriptional regulator [Deltaproteobacteria bacterium]|nr:large transcriptional regulator [Deltaproteobacteria bacterium]
MLTEGGKVTKAKRTLVESRRMDVVGRSRSLADGDADAARPLPLLCLRVLGELELWRGTQRLELPPSKKTRALLAYLAVTQRAQRRERLCSMFWDVTDDPRAALRWSLSKLRALVDACGAQRIIVDGSGVGFDAAGARVDLFTVREHLATPASAFTGEQLVAVAAEFRGEFLEGLDLPDFQEFQFWCLAMREEARLLHARVLRSLVDRLVGEPEQALPYARTLVQIDPLNVGAYISLLQLLAQAGRSREAEQHYDAAQRLLRDLRSPEVERLTEAWSSIGRGPSLRAVPALAKAEAPVAPASPGAPRLVGRQEEWSRTMAALKEVTQWRHLRVVTVAGEPGIGKTRLLEELLATVRGQAGTVLDGCAYEAEMSRPYVPWIDALRRIASVSVGDTIGSDLAPLLAEPGASSGDRTSRDRLFGAVVELIAARAHSAPPVLVVFDDAHWCDDASAELLHYVARMSRSRAVLILLAVRAGELPDNQPMLRFLRSVRREGLLDEIEVAPLSAAETEELIRAAAPGTQIGNIPAEVAGNPLFALELARAQAHRAGPVPATLRQLVRDRIERLPHDAAEVLRWGAVVGPTFQVHRLSELAPFDIERLVSALESLERHALLRAVPDGAAAGTAYSFAHEIVRQVVYAELSGPRRKLMHQRIASALQSRMAEDVTLAADLAHHAALAGDAAAAARACVLASRRYLRLFAATEANATARRGMHHAAQLPEPEQVRLMLELAEIRYAAHRPRRATEAARIVEELAQRALDQGCMEHARLGFHVASYIRWEGGEWSDAQRQMMRAEQVSRLGDERERVVALAEAARCLTMLERDLSHADALIAEAGALSTRLAIEPAAIPDAIGMLRLHEGRLNAAAEHFQRARELCRKEEDRLGEFRALEHLVMVELQRRRLAAAQALCAELVQIAGRLREGSEAPFARAVSALCRYASTPEAASELDAALTELRAADAKQRLGYVLRSAAEVELQRGDASTARRRANEALRHARCLERPSDEVLARVALARAAALLGDELGYKRQRAEVTPEALRHVSAEARAAVAGLRAGDGGVRATPAIGRRRRRTKGA